MYYRTKLFSMVVVELFLISLSHSQELLPVSCNLQAVMPMSTQRGGRYITASGDLNVLFVYVQFPDDDFLPSNSDWPKGQAPAFMSSTVDPVWSATPTPGGFTDYFNQMSFNSLRITGQSVSVITPHTRGWYLDSSWTRGDIQEEVLKQLDATIDFGQFDHWRWNGEYSNTNVSDGNVDMILMMWRNISDIANVRDRLDLIPGGEASLGYYGLHFNHLSFPVDDNARTIQKSYQGYGSGITAINPVGAISKELLWQYARHEFSHWLLGANEYHTKLGTWGMLNGWGTPSQCINSFERYKLGWMNFTDVTDITTTRTISGCTLSDFVTSGVAYRIVVPGGGSDEYYLLENHQRISTFDVPDNNVSSAKGIFVLLQQNDQGNSIGIVSAEGRYDWTVPYQLPNVYGGGGNLPVFQRVHSDKVSGYSKRENVPWTWGGYQQSPQAIHYHLDFFTGVLHQAPPTIFTGDGTDQFDLNTAPVFTPSSNPSSDLHNNANKIGFEITGLQTGVYTFNVHVNTTLNTAPSNPQDVTVTLNASRQAVVNWTANSETDVTGYDIFRATYYDGLTPSYSKLNSALLSSPTFTDNLSLPDGIPPGKDVYWRYRVIAKDNQNKYSAPSEDGWLYAGKSTSGTISASTTWDANRVLVGDVTVNGGATLTVAPGVCVYVTNGYYLNVSGALCAQGTAGHHVTLRWPGSTGGIVLNGAHNSTLQYCDVLNSLTPIAAYSTNNLTVSHCLISNSMSNGIRISGTSGTVSYNTIQYCQYGNGIVVQGGASPAIYGNTIQHNYYNGIYIISNGSGFPTISSNYLNDNGMPGGQYYCNGMVFTASSGIVQNNSIQLSNSGIVSYDGGSVYGYDYGQYPFWTTGDNTITNCRYGLLAQFDSYMDLGYFDTWNYLLGGSCNSFYSNTSMNAVACDNSGISAEANWWGIPYQSAGINTWNGGWVDDLYALGSQGGCWDFIYGDRAAASQGLQANISTPTPSIQTQRDLQEARYARRHSKYDEARKLYKAVILKGTSALRQQVLAEFFTMLRDSKQTGIVEELEAYSKDKSDIQDLARRLLPYAHVAVGRFDDAAAVASNLKATVSDKEIQKNLLVLLATLKHFDTKYCNTSAQAIGELRKDFAETIEPGLLAAIDTETDKSVLPSISAKDSLENLPNNDAVLSSYPNPFNPSTQIRFKVKETARISLKVFDMLGREVVTLLNEVKTPGTYNINWSAGQLATGIYFARFEAGGKVTIQKLLYLK